eukprot:CAMPEP_0196757950 /NCGR_PEP_ID=MMETSP1091-20130531/103931_1 /TAXON_ID=302021 /ORGANISM="Rhodomonas sp., Strain CCMP768" /LENGTH=242 /DNA_ID=CAMNT_0042106745 /DNA_START=33 /DNA_END=761 /DNA_ORIENTATION=-
MVRHADELDMGCMDRTFPKGIPIRCTALVGIVINFILFTIGFIITAYGARLAIHERRQIDFLTPNENGTLSDAVAEDLSVTISAMSGLTFGMTIIGSFAILVSVIGLCGSVRGSLPCLYCYSVLLVIILVAKAIVVAALSSQVADLDESFKEMIQASADARDLIKKNGQQVMYFGAFAFVVEFTGFIFSLIARCFLKARQEEQEDWRGNEMSDMRQLREVRADISEEIKKGKMRSRAIRLED